MAGMLFLGGVGGNRAVPPAACRILNQYMAAFSAKLAQAPHSGRAVYMAYRPRLQVKWENQRSFIDRHLSIARHFVQIWLKAVMQKEYTTQPPLFVSAVDLYDRILHDLDACEAVIG